jgi:hypothetical protein
MSVGDRIGPSSASIRQKTKPSRAVLDDDVTPVPGLLNAHQLSLFFAKAAQHTPVRDLASMFKIDVNAAQSLLKHFQMK